jgi:hypothetical protein
MRKIALGVFGLAVAANVRRFRGDTSYAELSRRLAEIGRPIPPLGLRHLEAGSRRIDVDDLVALALALDVTPIALLAPEDASPQELQKLLLWLMGGVRPNFGGTGTLTAKVEVKYPKEDEVTNGNN